MDLHLHIPMLSDSRTCILTAQFCQSPGIKQDLHVPPSPHPIHPRDSGPTDMDEMGCLNLWFLGNTEARAQASCKTEAGQDGPGHSWGCRSLSPSTLYPLLRLPSKSSCNSVDHRRLFPCFQLNNHLVRELQA